MSKQAPQSLEKRALLLAISVGIIAAVMSVATVAKQRSETELFDRATGYRLSAYRAAAPASIEGGKLINLDELEQLIVKDKPLLIDVMSVEQSMLHRYSFGLLGKNSVRTNIPGSLWMPTIGQGKISDADEAAMKTTLAKLTKGDVTKPMVFYCLSDCWVSWNAARRAITMGYKQVYWFKDGTDVWNDAGLELVPAQIYQDKPAQISEKK
jgi:PQQ-dependent catabolism-associated CXXCW motif protein